MGLVPYRTDDDTRAWLETFRVDGKIHPNLVLRIATDTNYILNQNIPLPAYAGKGPINTKGVMNNALPGMRIPHVQNWTVQETIDNPVATASFEVLNVLQVSPISATMVGTLSSEPHSTTIERTYVADGRGVVVHRDGDIDITNSVDDEGIQFREGNVKYRTFESQWFDVDDASQFPDASIPDDVDGRDVELTYPDFFGAADAHGSYFVLIDQEVVRISHRDGNRFYILPGGRAQANLLQRHTDAQVRLLSFGPDTGDYAGWGYLTLDDFKPYKNILRPGTCLVSYEGYGNFPSQLSHDFSSTRNYQFTGYWFVKGLENSLGEDGIPRLRVDLVGPGELLNKQKITPDLVQRIRTQFGQWRVNGQTIWGAAGHKRDIPGDWVDYNSWDPTLKDSYPLKIKTEFAQHKEFLEHMRETRDGLECPTCMAERKEWLKNHPDPEQLAKQWENMPDGAEKDKLKQRIWNLSMLQQRAIGRHVYKQSIRVLREPAGPIKTYIRLMGTMAAAAWDHPAYGTQAAQHFTKIPNELFDNIRRIDTGLVYNGQVDFDLLSKNKYDWTSPTYKDKSVIGRRAEITCPFESTYDKAPFLQPMIDLAEVNGNKFWIDRRGRPVFMPADVPLRPFGDKSSEKFEYFLKYGGSISAYSHSLNPEAVITQAWVTAVTAFDSTFTVSSGGTGWSGTKRIIHSPLAGNKEGLALTSGVQQVETISMENQVLGLDWNTEPANWGIQQKIVGTMDEQGDISYSDAPNSQDRTMVLNAKPALFDGSPRLSKGTKYKNETRRVQRTINFFLIRQYLPPVVFNGKSYFTIHEDGNFGELTERALEDLQNYLLNNMPEELRPTAPAELEDERDDKEYRRVTFEWIRRWLNQADDYIQTDIWWYAAQGRTWEEYVGAITGVRVPMLRNKGVKRKRRTSKYSIEEPLYTIDDKGMQREVEQWHKNFVKSAVNVGNRLVDDSINQASVRSISVNHADPRIQPGDILWCEIPGYLTGTDHFGRSRAPFSNGIYVTSIQRTMDLVNGTYNGSYSGYRYRGDFGISRAAGTGGFDF